MRLTVGPLTRLTVIDINRIAYGFPYTDVRYVRGSYISAPAANSDLVAFTVPSTNRGAIVAVLIDATEANFFDIAWTSGGTARSYRLRLPGDGVVSYDFRPGLNLDLPADPGSVIAVRNVNNGAAGSQYKADILIGLW
ncbi:hypothetical protein [Pyrobaculum sp.]|uniref:hypothetical protein n=1 Tax=Pyrobaculum sp. TaxID=2004705 RepID=UPI0031828222